MSAKARAATDARESSSPVAALALAGGTYAFLRYTGAGKKLSETMRRDIQAIKERDPAARSDLEIITCYPGLHALWLHRFAHALWQRQVPVAPRVISQVGRLLTGIEIHPGARLGEGLFIDHGAGVVIGETAEIGENVTIYQGVTLGGTGKEAGKRHPTVGDNVVIGAGSQLLGSITVGANVKVGAGSVVVHDVPSDSTVVGNPGRPVILGGAKVGIPDIDYTHLPDPVAEAMKCLVRRVVQLENELEEIRTAEASVAPESAVAAGSGVPATAPSASGASVPAAAERKASGRRPRPKRPIPAAEVACDPVRLEGVPEI
jgi:serine O-acetyltransferase